MPQLWPNSAELCDIQEGHAWIRGSAPDAETCPEKFKAAQAFEQCWDDPGRCITGLGDPRPALFRTNHVCGQEISKSHLEIRFTLDIRCRDVEVLVANAWTASCMRMRYGGLIPSQKPPTSSSISSIFLPLCGVLAISPVNFLSTYFVHKQISYLVQCAAF